MAGTITRVCACARRLAQVGIGAAGVTLSWSISLAPIAQGLERTNFHGRTVSLRGGVGAAAGAQGGDGQDRPVGGHSPKDCQRPRDENQPM